MKGCDQLHPNQTAHSSQLQLSNLHSLPSRVFTPFPQHRPSLQRRVP